MLVIRPYLFNMNSYFLIKISLSLFYNSSASFLFAKVQIERKALSMSTPTFVEVFSLWFYWFNSEISLFLSISFFFRRSSCLISNSFFAASIFLDTVLRHLSMLWAKWSSLIGSSCMVSGSPSISIFSPKQVFFWLLTYVSNNPFSMRLVNSSS